MSMTEEERKISVAEVRRTVATSLAAAFGFVIALMWNNVVLGAFATAGINLTQQDRNWFGWGILAATAVGITVVLVALIILISRWGGRK